MNSLPVLVVLSSAHEVLYRRYFEPSLPPGLCPVVCEMGTNRSDGAYLSEEWQDAMCAKVRHALQFCHSASEGQLFIVSDVDVQFFEPFSADEFVRIFEGLGRDLGFQRERFREGDSEANCGFYAGRNTPAVRRLLEAALADMQQDRVRNEQNAVNRMMRVLEIPYATLDRRFYARTHGFPPPPDLWMHHASWTTNIPAKIRQLERVRRVVRGGRIRMHAESLAEHLSRTAGAGLRLRALRDYLQAVPLRACSLP